MSSCAAVLMCSVLLLERSWQGIVVMALLTTTGKGKGDASRALLLLICEPHLLRRGARHALFVHLSAPFMNEF